METVYMVAPAMASKSPGVNMNVRIRLRSVLHACKRGLSGSPPTVTASAYGASAYQTFGGTAWESDPFGSKSSEEFVRFLLGFRDSISPTVYSSAASTMRCKVHLMIPTRCKRRELNALWIDFWPTRPFNRDTTRSGKSGPEFFKSHI